MHAILPTHQLQLIINVWLAAATAAAERASMLASMHHQIDVHIDLVPVMH